MAKYLAGLTAESKEQFEVSKAKGALVQYNRTKKTGLYKRSNAHSNVDYKIWLKKDGAVFGELLYEILTLINSTSSIAQAARNMCMSYRLTWGKIREAESSWGMPLVLTQVGGEMGGGTVLTPQAQELLQKYRSVKQRFDRLNLEINQILLSSAHAGGFADQD